MLKDKVFRKRLVQCCRQTIESPRLWQVGSSYKFSIPKTPYSYRNVDWIDFEDIVRYTGLVFEIAPTIEAQRIPAASDVVFSYRFSKHGYVIDKRYNYKSFREKSSILSKQSPFRVKINTDISNFYDRLNLHRLESSLASLGCGSKYVSCLNELLFFWADRNSFGLPVGCDASRFLAEAALIPVDRALQREGIKFVRFVDDYRIFAKSFSQAHAYLNILIQELDKESLFINTSKTTFIDLEQHRTEPSEEPQKAAFDPEDEDARVEEKTFVTVGYISKLIKTYRYPGREQIKRYKNEVLTDLKNKTLNSRPDNLEENIRYFVRCFIYNDSREIIDLIDVIDRYVHSLTYIVDALIKEEGRFSDSEVELLSKAFCEMYEKYARSPFFDLAILRLLCHGRYQSLDFVRRTFDGLKLSTNPIFLREFILRTRDIADREMLLSFRRLYSKVSLPVRRAIFHVIEKSDKLLDGEKYAWFKQVHKSEADHYLKVMAGVRLGSRSKQKA
ncbi:hypothetical protein BHAOGJBA_5369 [Methylobacterium hispanicum]|uniref:Reverse transcriptase domain-containing protein n=1 Tax=Methylobacterium hispanicum TaxID=270350 RepID=A0AAV4ZUM3_9HYPH|nr:hypothetical protein BHAOGJBA_5369 [Methylobacterium hispanicum]